MLICKINTGANVFWRNRAKSLQSFYTALHMVATDVLLPHVSQEFHCECLVQKENFRQALVSYFFNHLSLLHVDCLLAWRLCLWWCVRMCMVFTEGICFLGFREASLALTVNNFQYWSPLGFPRAQYSRTGTQPTVFLTYIKKKKISQIWTHQPLGLWSMPWLYEA